MHRGKAVLLTTHVVPPGWGQEWKRALRHLRTALERARWPREAPPEAVLLSWVGRIAANSFGLHVLPPAPAPGARMGSRAAVSQHRKQCP